MCEVAAVVIDLVHFADDAIDPDRVRSINSHEHPEAFLELFRGITEGKGKLKHRDGAISGSFGDMDFYVYAESIPVFDVQAADA
jgi:hypothetical protein